MAHRANANFYLYTGLTANASECTEAYEYLNGTVGLNFVHLYYGDPAQIPEVLSNLQTWFPEGDQLAFPLVIYDEIYDLTDQPNRVPRYVNGLASIKSTDWAALTSFAG
jgi:hypothetical protein